MLTWRTLDRRLWQRLGARGHGNLAMAPMRPRALPVRRLLVFEPANQSGQGGHEFLLDAGDQLLGDRMGTDEQCGHGQAGSLAGEVVRGDLAALAAI